MQQVQWLHQLRDYDFQKSYVDGNLIKSQMVSVHKLHNIVQSIEFYWLNSPLNQLQILCNARNEENEKQQQHDLHRSRQKIVDGKKIASRLCINKDIQVWVRATGRVGERVAKVAKAYFSKLIYRYFFLIYLFVWLDNCAFSSEP